ncbi:MAG: hypothetical protein E6G33_13275 [Actinobacteria bacterium]|nr:MAG: hypothetical protein E6G33_13275 [Actinomycetota bacterium]
MNLQGLSYELSLRALGQQERGLEELRNRTGTLLAASSLVASFLGARAIDRVGVDGIALVPLLAFILSVLLSVYVLAPKANLEFALRGSEVWEYFVSEDDDLSEAHRTLAYWIDDVHANNQGLIDRLLICFSTACFALVVEAVLWALELGGTLD